MRIVLFLTIWLLTTSAYATTFNDIVNAIYKAEGGEKARYAYGIVSVKYKDIGEAKRICYNTVKNNYIRWQKAGAKGNFIDFLGNVYCPIGAENDPKGLNKYWKKNVRFYLRKDVKYSILNEQRLKRQG